MKPSPDLMPRTRFMAHGGSISNNKLSLFQSNIDGWKNHNEGRLMLFLVQVRVTGYVLSM